MERFYGNDISVALTTDDAERLIRDWHERAHRAASSDEERALVDWLAERLETRQPGFRAFRIAPPPEPLTDESLDLLAAVVRESAMELTSRNVDWFGSPLSEEERWTWLANLLDVLSFVNEARGVHPDTGAPAVDAVDAHEVMLRRMWRRFSERSRLENFVFPDDPRYPDPEDLLQYLDVILEMAEADGREKRGEWPFPKILWEREILLEKLGRYDELADTMRRSAALQSDETFQRQTEEYIATLRR
jgi:hypothetical protein